MHGALMLIPEWLRVALLVPSAIPLPEALFSRCLLLSVSQLLGSCTVKLALNDAAGTVPTQYSLMQVNINANMRFAIGKCKFSTEASAAEGQFHDIQGI